jgi:hypothetical protein
MHGLCVICASTLNRGEEHDGDRIGYDCPLCGRYVLSGTAEAVLLGKTENIDESTLLSFAIRKMQRGGRVPVLDSRVVEQIMITTKLPSPAEQADELIQWLGKNIKGPGESIELRSHAHRTIIGAKSPEGFRFVIDHLEKSGLLDRLNLAAGVGGSVFVVTITLTFKGWEKYYELERGASASKKVFMAMKYGEPDLEEMFATVFQPAVEQTGFRLERLIDNPKAGLIDNRLRVDILTSRFLIADLTHGNPGAYWEAGYAEGLGKPVIYICEETVFDAKSTHFDTNHHYTVRWRIDKLKETTEDLKATIRATLPAEAKLEDE